MRAVAVVGPTATGKSALALAIAARFDGVIIACDSTAGIGIDIGTDKVPPAERRGIPHYPSTLPIPSKPTRRQILRRRRRSCIQGAQAGRLPVLVGGTGFYYRALVRGLFPGPARDEALRARLERVAARRGVESLHRWLVRVDPDSGQRIQPRDLKRIVRALEVYLLTGRPLTAHFGETTSPIAGVDLLTIGVDMPREELWPRVSRRVDDQFSRGVVDEVKRLLAAGVPSTAHAFSGLVYRQIVEMLGGVRDEPATRELIVRENMRYARRQLIWFRKEPNVRWLQGPGESDAVAAEACALVEAFMASS